MGSILMHLCISGQLRKKYNFSERFLVGSVLPDIYKKTTMTKNESHYIERIENNEYVYYYPNLKDYVEKHKDQIFDDEITIGYYAHLVEDYVWFKYISGQFSKVRIDEDEKNLVRYKSDNYETIHQLDEFGDEMYKDYYNTNAWLLKKYPVDINNVIKLTKEYTNDDCSASIIKESCEVDRIYRDGKNEFLTEDVIERYIKASIEQFELNWCKIQNIN